MHNESQKSFLNQPDKKEPSEVSKEATPSDLISELSDLFMTMKELIKEKGNEREGSAIRAALKKAHQRNFKHLTKQLEVEFKALNEQLWLLKIIEITY